MEVMEVRDLKKEYRTVKKEEGIRGSIRHLIKPRYGKKEAVKGVSFSIAQGESVAFLGANGAGKSTTIKMLTGILKPSGGEVSIMGKNPFCDRMENAKKIGVVFGQKTQLWWDIPVIETFRLLKNIYEIPDDRYEKNMREFREILDLDAFLGQPARKLSLGQRVRADMAAALLHEPPILFLDEPTIGLDVAVKQKIYAFLRRINLAILFILLLIFFCQKLVRILGAAVDGDIPANLVLSLLGLGVPACIQIAVTSYTAETEEVLVFQIGTVAPAEYLKGD